MEKIAKNLCGYEAICEEFDKFVTTTNKQYTVYMMVQ